MHIRRAERQEALLWGAGTAVLIKAQAGDTMGGEPLFIHQPPLPFGRVRRACVLVYVCGDRRSLRQKEFEDTELEREGVREKRQRACVSVCVCAFVPFSWQANVGLWSVRFGSCTCQASAHAHSFILFCTLTCTQRQTHCLCTWPHRRTSRPQVISITSLLNFTFTSNPCSSSTKKIRPQMETLHKDTTCREIDDIRK